jgi:hypothetical protein
LTSIARNAPLTEASDAASARLMRLSASPSSFSQVSRVTTIECAAALAAPWPRSQ